MPIFHGGKEITSIFFGSDEISSVYYGSDLVFGGSKIIDLGEGTIFDVKSKYKNYSDLTVDNFFFQSATQAKINAYEESGQVDAFDGITKTYNASSGTLNMSIYARYGTTKNSEKVHAFLVVKPEKLISLGTATSFNVSSYSNFKKFTVDNFLIKKFGIADTSTGQEGKIGGVRDPHGFTITTDIVKMYNANRGIFTCYLFGEYLSSKTNPETWSSSLPSVAEVYLNPRV